MLVRGEQSRLKHRSVNYAAEKVLRHGAMAMDKKTVEKSDRSKTRIEVTFCWTISLLLTDTNYFYGRSRNEAARVVFFYLFTRGFLYLHQALSYKTFYYYVVN